MASEDSGCFSIDGLGSGFASRQRDLFACLDAADRERGSTSALPPLPVEDEVERSRYDNKNSDSGKDRGRMKRPPTKHFRGKESIFKRPEMPAPRRARHSMPDYQRNPHKYTKYSLGDVSSQDMSDKSNTATALSFLRELKARKENSQDMEVDDSSAPRAILFNSSRSKTEKRTSSLGAVNSVTTSSTSEEADRPSFRSTKVVMPEYVVGQKVSKKKSSKSTKHSEDVAKSKASAKGISLGHLMDEEEDV